MDRCQDSWVKVFPSFIPFLILWGWFNFVNWSDVVPWPRKNQSFWMFPHVKRQNIMEFITFSIFTSCMNTVHTNRYSFGKPMAPPKLWWLGRMSVVKEKNWRCSSSGLSSSQHNPVEIGFCGKVVIFCQLKNCLCRRFWTFQRNILDVVINASASTGLLQHMVFVSVHRRPLMQIVMLV